MKLVVPLVIACLVAIPATNQGETASTKAALPVGLPVRSTELACEAILNANIWQETGDQTQLVAETSRGTDKLAIKVGQEKLKFITRASVEAGMAEPAEFILVANEENYLMAVGLPSSPVAPSLSAFVLNKTNGLAAWTKSRPHGLLIDTPEVQSFYLFCR